MKKQKPANLRATGAGDPAETLVRLWRRAPASPQRGPRPALDIASIVAAAVGIADEEGLDAVSMRRLAEHFAVVPMTLYTYVPGKAELLELLVDHTYASMTRKRPRDRSWQARLKAVLDDNRALYQRHPWLAELSIHRPPLGPGVMAKYEYELSALVGTGLGDVELDAALTFALGLVASCARAAADKRAIERDTRMSDAAWWRANEALLATMFDPTRFPTATRVGGAAGEYHGAAYDPDFMYSFGVQRVVDGLEALIAQSKR